jgi:hypothetical protein
LPGSLRCASIAHARTPIVISADQWPDQGFLPSAELGQIVPGRSLIASLQRSLGNH